jgi:pimeloyl-ACP methyl ester carboxylesterase
MRQSSRSRSSAGEDSNVSSAVSPDGIPIRYAAEGTGSPAIVFVHGWSCDRSYWRGQVGPFAAGQRVVAVDLAGHGESGADRRSWTMPAFGADVATVVDDAGLDDVVLVGHSMGGDVILEAALRLEGRVRGLVWVDTYRSLGEPSTPEGIEAFIAPFRRDFVGEVLQLVRGFFPPTADGELVEWVAADMAAAPPEIALDALRHSIGNEGPAIDALARLDAPRAAINPDYRPSDVASLARYGFRTVILDGVGHFSMLEDPVQFNRALEDVVASFA